MTTVTVTNVTVTVLPRSSEALLFRRSGMALPPVLGQDTDSDAGNIADNDSLASFLSGTINNVLKKYLKGFFGIFKTRTYMSLRCNTTLQKYF